MGARHVHIDPLPYYRGTSAQVCGLWPFSTAASAPVTGAPIGPHLSTGSLVCFDHISWFTAGLISNPTIFLIGNIHLGKSSFARRLAMWADYTGAINLIPGDIKPDYIEPIEAMGGQIIKLKPGAPALNPLDIKGASGAINTLKALGRADLAKELTNDVNMRKQNAVAGLIAIARGSDITDREDNLLAMAIAELDNNAGTPTLKDLFNIIEQGADPLLTAADAADRTDYLRISQPLKTTLRSLTTTGRMSGIFAGHTLDRFSLDKHMVYDISAIPETNTNLVAAAFYQCSNEVFAAVSIANALADAGVKPQRHYNIIQDELWRQLTAAPGMVDRMNITQRLVRSYGVGQIQITHAVGDLDQLINLEERAKAKGLISKAGAVITAGLSPDETMKLSEIRPLTQKEQAHITSWQDPATWNTNLNAQKRYSPGLGKFLIKVGRRPGIPVQLMLTEAEINLYDTNKRWKNQ